MLHNRLAKLREERENGEHGFTLIELLVVVVIIGILIAIAIPLYLNYKKGAADKSAQSDLRNAISTLEQCNANNSSYPATTSVTLNTPNGVCSSQTINTSSGTTLNYIVDSAGKYYALQAWNSGGNSSSSSYYCYSNYGGGSVALSTKTFATASNVSTFTC